MSTNVNRLTAGEILNANNASRREHGESEYTQVIETTLTLRNGKVEAAEYVLRQDEVSCPDATITLR